MARPDPPICSPRSLPPQLLYHAAEVAVHHNPANAPMVAAPLLAAAIALIDPHALGPILSPQHIAVYTTRRWKPGTTLTVGFLESTIGATIRNRILSHLKAWEAYANINFAYTQSARDATIRITLNGDGYWSYIGTDILTIPPGEPTMCLQDWSSNMPDSEFRRVIRHETGHTLGSPHEHSRRAIVARLDPARTIAYFRATQGWDEQTIRDQILTPVDESELVGTPGADDDSIMAYQFPGSITIDGRPIVGGDDITSRDGAFMASVYPGRRPDPEPPVPEPPEPPPVNPGLPAISIGGKPVSIRVGPNSPALLRMTLPPGAAYPVLFAIDIDVPAVPGHLFGPRLRPVVSIRGTTRTPPAWVAVPLDRRGVGMVLAVDPGTYEIRVEHWVVRRLNVRLRKPPGRSLMDEAGAATARVEMER